jgi:hypothetical protein
LPREITLGLEAHETSAGERLKDVERRVVVEQPNHV